MFLFKTIQGFPLFIVDQTTKVVWMFSLHQRFKYSLELIYFCTFEDDLNTTCDVIPGSGYLYAEFIWTYPDFKSSVHLFRFVLSGSQPCASTSMFWFTRGENATWAPSQCEVDEFGIGDFRVCFLTCRCMDLDSCRFLHYRVQFLPWIGTSLSVCHFFGLVHPDLTIY